MSLRHMFNVDRAVVLRMKFSKIGLLLNILCKMNEVLTFENFLQMRKSNATSEEIRKSQLYSC